MIILCISVFGAILSTENSTRLNIGKVKQIDREYHYIVHVEMYDSNRL